ncbi:phage portal protein [Lactococcus lactis]|uniref:Phage portal protein n=1 Tax=Lactococcus lactis TaxID=1358 RepID=A0A6B3S3K9_9LACT|nr:phage portal protein [Lactococcus lactis]MCT1195268.1 phage portal protein [Lactococcus lactis]NEX49356.1 phage portal protein [Lactococcus lactis]NEX52807.1 phage portal protein [Lactococcus lactis]NEX55410.1 phage portal protein [Lactococcus lactis]
MDVKTAIKLYKMADLDSEPKKAHRRYREALKYYLNKNDITNKTDGESKANATKDDELLRKSDSRVSNNFHQLLVDQKASYVGSVKPKFDLGNDDLNKIIDTDLGDKFARTVQRLVIDSSNGGDAWLHVWLDETEGNKFKYTIVSPEDITPIYDNSIERKIIAIKREYISLDDETGKNYHFVEFWTAEEAAFFKFEESYLEMLPNDCIISFDKTALIDEEAANVLKHKFEGVPFIRFPNNLMHTNDLDKYKGLIDVYDKVYNGFVNDIEDVQQVILVLTNYGGADLREFMSDLRQSKAIKIDSDSGGDKSGVDKLTIDIPVEARNSLLEKTLDAIFLQGQGVNPTKLELGNNSGVALKMLYGLLELKASALESEYRVAFNQLIHYILQAHNKDKDDLEITQTWERASVQNWQEKADMVAKLSDVTSKQNIAKNNPLVEDWEKELKLLEEQGQDSYGTDPNVLAEEVSTGQAGAAGQGGDLREGVQPKAKADPKGN